MGMIVCLTAGKEFYSREIRRLTHANVNHAFLAYESKEWGGWWAVQADERGIVKVPVENIEYEYIECYEFGLDLMSAAGAMRDKIGEPYDWMGIAGFLAKLYAWRIFGRKIVNPLHRKGALFCSELVTMWLQHCESMYLDIYDLDPSSVAPGGDPIYLGTPSLQWVMQKNEKIKRVECPWEETDNGVLRLVD